MQIRGLYLNICGICSNFNELEAICIEEYFDFICLSETHLTEDIEDGEICIQNYNIIRCDSISRHTGGVCFYINNKWKIRNIDNSSIGKQIWWLKIEIRSESVKYNLIGLYRSPHKQNSPEGLFINFFENEMDKIKTEENNLIIGDFNIDWLVNNNHKKKLEEIINDNYFQQIVTTPTRITQTTSTLIDYAVTNIDEAIVHTKTKYKISDHESLEIKIPAVKANNSLKTKTIKNIRFNNNNFRNLIQNSELFSGNAQHAVNNSAYTLVNTINNALNSMIVIKEIGLENSSKQWYNGNLKEMKSRKIQLYNLATWCSNENNWNNYRQLRNQYTAELERTKGNYINNKINECESQKEMWLKIKEFVLKKDFTGITELEIKGAILSRDKDIAEELNAFFINSVSEIVASIPYIQYDSIINVNPELNFKFKTITLYEIKKTITLMNNKKDQYYLTKKNLLENFDILGEKLYLIINDSLITGTFPDCLKESCIVPIQKVKNTKNPNEIRPVNMLTNISKLMEKIVYKQIVKYFEDNNLFCETQSGFRKHHSCESLLNLVITQWKTEIHNKNCIVAVFLDLKRAFETVDKDILLQKLESYGVKGIELQWFKSYLHNRTQRTRIGSYLSSPKHVDIGVPQGAVLGTLLFLIYINDFQNILTSAKICMFADDALIYVSGKNPSECIRVLNEEMEKVDIYLKMNKLKLNTNKTKAMIINGRVDEDIYISGVTIEKVKEIKYLGILLDDKLKFDVHINYICKKIVKKVAFLRRIRCKISTTTAITIYNTIIKPHFEYCSTIIFLGTHQMKERMQKLQNKAMRCILRCHRLTHIKDMLNRLRWLSVNQRLMMNAFIFIFKIKNKLLPSYMQNFLIYVSDLQPYNLRNVNNFRVAFSSTNFYQNLLLQNGLKMFNEMPQEIKSENNFFIFKSKVVEYVKLKF